MRSLAIRSLMAAVLLVSAFPAIGVATAGPVGVGKPVSFVDQNGVEQARVTVTSVLDPFTDYPQGEAPDAGTKFVLVVLTFEGTGDTGIESYSGGVYLHDATGALWSYGFPNVPDDFAQPELSNTTVGQGSQISGYVGYVVPEDRVIDGVFISAVVGGHVLLIPADLGLARPSIGESVDVTERDGATAALTIKSIVDPYKGYDKKRPPADGSRFTLVTASATNSGDTPFRLEHSGFVLRDANGYVWGETSITYASKPKLKDLDSVDLAKTDEVSGLLAFAVPAGVALEGLYYQSDAGLFRLADLSAAPANGDSAVPTCEVMRTYWSLIQPVLTRLVGLPPFQPNAGPMDETASKAMLKQIQSLRGGDRSRRSRWPVRRSQPVRRCPTAVRAIRRGPGGGRTRR